MSAFSLSASLKTIIGLSLLVVLAGCTPFAVQPPGPSVMVLPPKGKPFEAYAQDHTVCKQFAAEEVAGADTQANLRTLGTVVTNAGLGAALGAAVGGGGAAIGAASGAIAGAYVGANDTPWGVYQIQNRYNDAFLECMYAKGNQIPMSASSSGAGYPSG